MKRSEADRRDFLAHTTADDRRAAHFVLAFTKFDAHTKVLTEELPPVNLTLVEEVIDYFFPGGYIVW